MIHADLFFFASHFYSYTDRHNTAHIDIIENTAAEFGRSSIQHNIGGLLSFHGISIASIHFQYHGGLLQEHKVPYDNYSVKDRHIAITFKLSALEYSSASSKNCSAAD